MSIDKVWVLAESTEGKPTSTTLELLTQARSMGGTTEAVAWGADTASVAAELGNYGATTVYDVGDLGDALPGAPVAGAIASLVASGNRPDVILVPASYDGRDIAARLSVRLDVPVITNVVNLITDGDEVRSQHGLFGGAQVATARFTGDHPWIFVVRAKSFTRRARRRGRAPGRERRRCPSSGPPTGPRSSPATPRSAPGRSSTRPRSWCRADGASEAPSTTP